ncbi:glycerol-3-phosphate dehydrogenase, mitochondrial-like, partial [Malurus melanocephalus]|uniref:glycerol-3-phosphate dehydrogenase, mitochondrial-like n=1 Tax=Malurus melanocephalus TaxID=175006 RepID=UPI0025484DDE
VAQHLASTYGDKAFEVAKIAQVTGKRWPIVGKRLVSEFPYIEAEEELETAKTFLYYEMGYKVKTDQLTDSSEISLVPSDIERYKKRFHMFDKDKKGFITILDVQRVLQSISVQIAENTLHEILNEVDLNKNGQVELNEFLQVRCALAAGGADSSESKNTGREILLHPWRAKTHGQGIAAASTESKDT